MPKCGAKVSPDDVKFDEENTPVREASKDQVCVHDEGECEALGFHASAWATWRYRKTEPAKK